MHTALRVVGIGRTASSVLPFPWVCPLPTLVTCPLLFPTTVSSIQQVQRFSRGSDGSSKSGNENKGGTVPEKTLDELRKEIKEIEYKQWTIDELRTEIKNVENIMDTVLTEKARQLEYIRNEFSVGIYNFNPKKYLLTEEQNELLKQLYKLNAKSVKKDYSNDELKNQLHFLKDIIKGHEMRKQRLNKEIDDLQNLVSDGVEAICELLEKNNTSQKNVLNVGKHENPRDKDTLELEIRHLKDELRYQKELLVRRIEYFNKTIIERTALINKIKSCGDTLLRLQAKDDIKKAKEAVVSNFKMKNEEEAEINKAFAEEKEKFKRVHSELKGLKKKLEEFKILCDNHKKQPK